MWEIVGNFVLSDEWGFVPTEANFFRFNFADTDTKRGLIAQYEEIDGQKFLYQIREFSNDPNRLILQMEPPYPMQNRGIALKTIWGDTISLELATMAINNPGSVSTVNNLATAIADSIPALTANTAAQLLAANTNRKFVTIVNNNTTGVDVTIILGGTAGAALGKGIVLKAGGGSLTISPYSDVWWTGAISAIAGSAVSAGQLGVVEGT